MIVSAALHLEISARHFFWCNKTLHFLFVLLLKGLYLCLRLNCPSDPRRSHHQNFLDITGAKSSAFSALVLFCLLVVHQDQNFTFYLHCAHTTGLRVLGLSCPLALSLSCSFPSCRRPQVSHHWLLPNLLLKFWLFSCINYQCQSAVFYLVSIVLGHKLSLLTITSWQNYCCW